mmetsp:Transcript_19408/g.49338  ORF Transcript_19408/g.49338 Transcript_19408/m.49338 type:complete len:209 (+) Transcript_19408:365-991(+)
MEARRRRRRRGLDGQRARARSLGGTLRAGRVAGRRPLVRAHGWLVEALRALLPKNVLHPREPGSVRAVVVHVLPQAAGEQHPVLHLRDRLLGRPLLATLPPFEQLARRLAQSTREDDAHAPCVRVGRPLAARLEGGRGGGSASAAGAPTKIPTCAPAVAGVPASGASSSVAGAERLHACAIRKASSSSSGSSGSSRSSVQPARSVSLW